MQSVGLGDAPYARALSAFAPRALASGAGIQSYASFRREPSGIRVTAYLSPELFRARAVHTSHQRLKAAVPPSTGRLTGSGSR
jgi:hypothetical protein